MTPLDTRVLAPTAAALKEAGALIRAGVPVAFPTETVYGLGANALDAGAVKRIFEAKGRPGDNPLIVHISALSQLRGLIACEPGPNARRMAEAFWPGPLTMIFPKAACIPDETSGGLDTVGIRLPGSEVARALIDEAGVPIAAPSANRSGRPSPTTAAHVLEDMDGRIPLILDGGACRVGLESTVVDMTDDIPHILRPGGVTREDILRVTGMGDVDPAVLRPLGEGEEARSPGMKYKHYAPAGELRIVQGSEAGVIARISEMYDAAVEDGRSPLIFAMDVHAPEYGVRRVERLGRDADEAAHRMFACLRDADALGADVLFSEAVDVSGVGLAVMNRLGRAAAFRIVDADEGAQR